MSKINYIDIKEFHEEGYLQEANRRFFHPLGLAMEISYDEFGNASISGIWDYRDDPEGIYYDEKVSSLPIFQERIEKFNGIFKDNILRREELLGYGIQKESI